MPYLPDESDFSNVNKFEFVIPEQDKEHLINRAVNANEYINENLIGEITDVFYKYLL